ncbi:MAG: aminotransferase class V-fold PLP-dependent enzyme [Gemmatimonadetes bacterium]|nr:alanine--glyoxylate aminotransferase family protein [Gemmatimonadota bacterium]NIR80669.1 alanine--glyoxylate aminotransferase family protein [Gemmatimonadota bacterium]NIT89460.1 alanine--glyoxylate aminotransferase family protein [Gemmatimonadota bacterium]NIU33263.1 alanine--glyoxylate aminotransferase family protein [Gemmatimonadota bacterium]NIU37568.1 aminotransferase class V-fold PLP-dependent enzyme [Gemmatimonadota bacterium]
MTEPRPTPLPESSGRFFLPGPTAVDSRVLAAQARAVIGHRGPGIRTLVARIQEGLRTIFRTDRPVFVSTSSATGLMEAAVRNGVRDRLLALVNGAFSERFAKIARACGKEVEVLEIAWGEAHEPGAVHSETSTGALNPIAEIASAVREASDALMLVDSVSGLGGADVRTDEWGLDFVLAGSQKALAVPPGLAFAVASKRMMERAESLPDRGCYFDLPQFRRKMEKLQTPNTPAVTLLYALDEQLGRIREEGLDARLSRHRAMAERCWAWVEDASARAGLDLRVLAPAGRRSPTVTCVLLPEGLRGPDVVGSVTERGWVIAPGYGKLREGAIRIGHMGEHTVPELDDLLEVLAESLSVTRAPAAGGA